jgi:hypothetical protein
MGHKMGTNQNNFQEPVRVRFVDTRRAARLALAHLNRDRLGMSAVLDDTLHAAINGDKDATTGLILAQAALLSLNVGALDEHTNGAASAGLRHYIAESIRLEEKSRDPK